MSAYSHARAVHRHHTGVGKGGSRQVGAAAVRVARAIGVPAQRTARLRLIVHLPETRKTTRKKTLEQDRDPEPGDATPAQTTGEKEKTFPPESEMYTARKCRDQHPGFGQASHKHPPHLGKEMHRCGVEQRIVSLGREETQRQRMDIANSAKETSMARNASKRVGVLIRDLGACSRNSET